MRSSLAPIPMILPVKPKYITAACVAKCLAHSLLWTVICWFIPGRDLSAAKDVDKLLLQMEICIGTSALMEVETQERVMSALEAVKVASPRPEERQVEAHLPMVGMLVQALLDANESPAWMGWPSVLLPMRSNLEVTQNVRFAQKAFSRSCLWNLTFKLGTRVKTFNAMNARCSSLFTFNSNNINTFSIHRHKATSLISETHFSWLLSVAWEDSLQLRVKAKRTHQ